MILEGIGLRYGEFCQAGPVKLLSVLAEHRVELIGARIEAIQKAESRELFAASMRRWGAQ